MTDKTSHPYAGRKRNHTFFFTFITRSGGIPHGLDSGGAGKRHGGPGPLVHLFPIAAGSKATQGRTQKKRPWGSHISHPPAGPAHPTHTHTHSRTCWVHVVHVSVGWWSAFCTLQSGFHVHAHVRDRHEGGVKKKKEGRIKT